MERCGGFRTPIDGGPVPSEGLASPLRSRTRENLAVGHERPPSAVTVREVLSRAATIVGLTL